MKLIYVLDPMCSWCWAFRPELEQFLAQHSELELELILGGLAPDSNEPMPPAQREQIEQIWHRIAAQTGAQFNHQFWRENTPRRSTYPACRAVIAAETISGKGRQMVEAIQQAYYLQALNPSDTTVLCDLAADLEIDKLLYAAALESSEVEQVFQQGLRRTHAMGVSGFPALILDTGSTLHALGLGYTQSARLEQRYQQARTA